MVVGVQGMKAPGVQMHVVLLGALAAIQESTVTCFPSFLCWTTLVVMSIHDVHNDSPPGKSDMA